MGGKLLLLTVAVGSRYQNLDFLFWSLLIKITKFGPYFTLMDGLSDGLGKGKLSDEFSTFLLFLML